MLETKALLEMKARMLLAADAASRIASGQGEPLELEPDVYELVIQSLAALPDDARAVLAELDILRGMFTGKFDSFFGVLEHGRSRDVEPVQPEASVGGGGGEQDDHTATGGAVRSDGADGAEGERPRPKRNRRRHKPDSERVES